MKIVRGALRKSMKIIENLKGYLEKIKEINENLKGISRESLKSFRIHQENQRK